MSDDTPLDFSCPITTHAPDRILLGHGGGGRLQRRLLGGLFRKHFRSSELALEHDGAYLTADLSRRLAFTTDSYVVRPLFFPGGDIGSLAVHGTVNDLAACGAIARWMSAAFILEEGFEIERLEAIVVSMARAAAEAGVAIVTGDTKVVERGKGDGLFIAVSGVGQVIAEPAPEPARVQAGDVVLINGPIGLHGMAILSVREGLGFEAEGLCSDSAPLGSLVQAVYGAGIRPHCLRDATRGGVAAALSEIAASSGAGMLIDEERVPVPEMVRGACEIFGLDPLLVANEGKMLFFVGPEDEAACLAALRAHAQGREGCRIGEVVVDEPGSVQVRTALGSTFVLDIPAGEELPRIC